MKCCFSLRVRLVFAALLGSYLSAPAGGDDGERKLTEAQRQVVAESSAWGAITTLKDGSLGLVYQRAQPLSDVDACNVSMQWIRSTDGGQTWSDPVLISERLGPNGSLHAPRPEGGYIVFQQRNEALGQLPSGRIVCAFCELNYHYDRDGKTVNNPDQDFNHQNQGVAYTWSDDLGKTWIPTRRMDSGPVGGPGGGIAPQWRIVTLPDGTALMSLYGSFNKDYRGPVQVPAGTGKLAAVARSTDNGETWGDHSVIFSDASAGLHQLFEETALCLVGDKLLAHMRRPQSDVVQFESGDGGRSWQGPTPLTQPDQHPGGAFVLQSGNLLATWGNRRPPYGAAAMLSTDRGATWNYEHRVSLAWDSPYIECGYANGTQAGDGAIVVTYYDFQPSKDYRGKWTGSKVYVVRFTEEQFKQAADLPDPAK